MSQLKAATEALHYWTSCALRDAGNGRGAGPARTAAAEWATIVLALKATTPATSHLISQGADHDR